MFKIRAKDIVIIQIIYCLFGIQWLEFFGVSNIKVLVSDALNILLFLMVVRSGSILSCHMRLARKSYNTTLLWILSIVIGLIFGVSLYNGASGIILAIWDLRLFIRPLLLLAFCIIFLDVSDIEFFYKLFYKLQYLNIVLTLFQYYVQGYYMDSNGGIFAPVQGCNKYSNLFCCLMLAWSIARYLKNKETLPRLIVCFGDLVVVALFAELKILFIEMPIIILLVLVLSGRTKKKWSMIFVSIVAILIGFLIFSRLFPESFQFVTDSELFMWYAYDMSYSNTAVSVNRLSGFDIINQYIIGASFWVKLLGYGVGAGGKIPFMNIESDLYSQYSSLHYEQFTYAWMYIEIGYIGLALFFLIFVMMFFDLKHSNMKDEYNILSRLFCVMVIFFCFYDACWITEGTGFLQTLVLSFGFISLKKNMTQRMDKIYKKN